MAYILGVDGGNTKTDYFLFDTNVNFIDFYRGSTCSHEGLKDGFAGSYRVMKEHLDHLLSKNNIKVSDIVASVFGLAGVDTPYQKSKLEEVVSKLGFRNYRVVNDSLLGIKAGTSKGIGVCSINGTGTSCGAIDKNDSYLQIGGIGAIVGDEAGGYNLSRKVVRAVYDAAYRFGKPTSLEKIVYDKLGVKDKYYLMEKISEYYLSRKVDYTTFTIACFEEANKGDEVAQTILKETAEQLARSAGGAVVNLDFDDPVEIVLAGSVWVKGSSPIMVEEFKKYINEFTKRNCIVKKLMVPPATGAIIWAFELYNKEFPNQEIRNKIIDAVKNELNRIEKS